MPVLIFPYSPDVYTDPDTQEVGYVYRPYLPVRLSYQGNTLRSPIDALLDSGADQNLFPALFGERLGIPVQQGLLIEHGGIGDSRLRAYRHTVTMTIGEHAFETTVDFSYDHRLPLLGREGFFAHFTEVLFRHSERVVKLTYSAAS